MSSDPAAGFAPEPRLELCAEQLAAEKEKETVKVVAPSFAIITLFSPPTFRYSALLQGRRVGNRKISNLDCSKIEKSATSIC